MKYMSQMNVPILGYFETRDGNFHKNTQRTNIKQFLLLGILDISLREPEITDGLRDKVSWLGAYIAVL